MWHHHFGRTQGRATRWSIRKQINAFEDTIRVFLLNTEGYRCFLHCCCALMSFEDKVFSFLRIIRLPTPSQGTTIVRVRGFGEELGGPFL